LAQIPVEGVGELKPVRAALPLWPWATAGLVLVLAAEAALFLRRGG